MAISIRFNLISSKYLKLVGPLLNLEAMVGCYTTAIAAIAASLTQVSQVRVCPKVSLSHRETCPDVQSLVWVLNNYGQCNAMIFLDIITQKCAKPLPIGLAHLEDWFLVHPTALFSQAFSASILLTR